MSTGTGDGLSFKIEPIFGSRRNLVRERLRTFLHDSKLSQREFAEIINNACSIPTNEDAIRCIATNENAIRRFLNQHAPRVGHDVVCAIEAYLAKLFQDPPPPSQDPPPPPVSPVSLFELARAFFRMRDHKIREYHHLVPGVYRFYAYSESPLGKSHVCLGAVQFNDDFSAKELQTWTRPGVNTVREEFEGHYIYRGASLIAMLRHASEMEPKFYILAIPSAGTEGGQRETLTGLLVKTGDGSPVFGTTIHMERNNHAFETTNVVPRDQVDKAILQILDSDQWLPRSASSAKS